MTQEVESACIVGLLLEDVEAILARRTAV